MKDDSVQAGLLAILVASGAKAIREDELREMSGLPPFSFKEAMIRLTRRELAVKWKNEEFENYVVASQFAAQAYYTKVVRTHPLNLLFGTGEIEVTVHRSIPFVVLEDEETKKFRVNRYTDELHSMELNATIETSHSPTLPIDALDGFAEAPATTPASRV